MLGCDVKERSIKKQGSRRVIVTGPSRSGTTLLAALLSQLGVNFGLSDRAWDINSGYYEHPQVLKVYEHISKWRKLNPVSDKLASFFYQRAQGRLAGLLNTVDAIKYPPLSSELPRLVHLAGYAPHLAISVRRFEPYALSRMRKEGAAWSTCKQDYLETYTTALFNLKIYGGTLFFYEDLRSAAPHPWVQPLMTLSGVEYNVVVSTMQTLVTEGRSQRWAALADADCDELYERMLSLR